MTELDDLTQPRPTEDTTVTSARQPGPSQSRGRADVLLLLLVVLLVGAYFRFLNVDWDEGEHLHPDERYMTMVTGAIRSPGSADRFQNPPAGCASWGGYFDSYCSPLNPYNHRGFGSYAYGTFPLFSARLTGEWLSGACVDAAGDQPAGALSSLQTWIAGLLFNDVEGCVGNRFTDYGHVHLLGRMLSALADLGAALLLFFIGRRLYGPWVGLLATALYALAVLPIQQSHFYTVDSFAGFFITLAGYLAVRGSEHGRWRHFILAGVTYGFGVASKVSVWPFAAVIALAALLYYVRSRSLSAASEEDVTAASPAASTVSEGQSTSVPEHRGAGYASVPEQRGAGYASVPEHRGAGYTSVPEHRGAGYASVPEHRGADYASVPEQRGAERAEANRVLDWLMLLLVVIVVFLIAVVALFGIWRAVKIAFYFAVALLFMGGLAFYILRPGESRRTPGTKKNKHIGVDGAFLRVLVAGLFAFLAFRAAQPYAFVGSNFDVDQWQAPEHDWLRGNVPDIWYTLNDKLPDPIRTLFLPDPRFIGTLASVNRQLTGEADVPWGHQWTNRLPFLFPWVNMVVWGMGLPLGLTVWAAWGWAGWELWRRKRRLQHFIPWTWAAVLFFYQGTQWVKSIRYLLPVYPFLILLGAWLLVRLWRKASRPLLDVGRRLTPVVGLRSVGYRLPLVVVVAGTFLWAWGFTRIYMRPVTRNTASRWMIENIPTAATLHYEVDGQAKTQFLRLPATHTYTDPGLPQISSLVLPEDGVVTGVTFTHLSDPDLDAAAESFQVTLAADVAGQEVLARVERTINLEQARHRLGDAQHFDLGPVSVPAAQEVYLLTQATDGTPIRLDTTVIANEYPDDSLPTRVDQRDPFGGSYRGLQSSGDGKTHWDLNEDESKLSQAVEWLDEADLIALSSNRGYASIPRLPGRYPMAIEYYRALFAEELGFELIASFASYPAIGPFQFPDQETPFAAGEPALIRDEMGSISVPLPPAEEAFSVYDHPQVFLFRKTEAYSRQRVEQVLGSVNLDQVVWMKPTEATLAPTALMHTEEELDVQRSGGTWTDIFDAGDWLNRSPLLSVGVWWALVQVVGLLAFPLLFFAAPGLRDRGWPLAKTLGLLLWATLVWLCGSSGVLTTSRPLIFTTLLLLAAVGGALAWWQRQELLAWVRRERRTLLVSELVYSGLFLLFLFIRYGNPDLWHPVMGGERPMDFAHLNAVIKSTRFPPYDPWFSGGVLNYYYFGLVIVGMPIKLLGMLPEIAYNLALPTFFALTGVGAFSVAYNLVANERIGESANQRVSEPALGESHTQHATRNTQHATRITHHASRITKYAIYAGLIAALFVAVMGNLSEIYLVVDGLHELGSRDFEFQSSIPGLEPLVTDLRGLVKHTLGGEPMPWRPEWPYWNASRAIPHPSGEAPPITEFPFFTFLYSDLHAHLLVLPLTLLALGFILSWTFDPGFWQLRGENKTSHRRRQLSALLGLVLGGIVIGSLRPTNTWDYVTYLALTPLALIIGFVTHRAGRRNAKLDFAVIRNGITAVAGRFAFVAALSYLVFLPYVSHYATASTGFELWKGSRTPLWAYFGVHGLFLFPVLTWLLLALPSATLKRRATGTWARLRPILAIIAVGLAMVTLFAVVAGYQVALLVLPFGFLALLFLIGPRTRPAQRLVALMSGVALALTLWVELMVLNTGDVGRMNTVFKFYLQAWVLFGIASAVCIVWLLRFSSHTLASPSYITTDGLNVVQDAGVNPVLVDTHAEDGDRARLAEQPIPRRKYALVLWQAWKGILVLLVGIAALYPILATRAKINDRWMRELGPGLDGLAWMRSVTDVQFGEGAPDGLRFPLQRDYEALMWLRENVQGSPVVAEGAKAPPYRSLRGRVATYTGLPIIIGYPWHQTQQRSFVKADVIGKRERDVNNLYDTTDPWLAQEILDRYDVSLVYVGDLERAHYAPAGIEKLAQMAEMGLLRSIYANEGVTIYQVLR